MEAELSSWRDRPLMHVCETGAESNRIGWLLSNITEFGQQEIGLLVCLVCLVCLLVFAPRVWLWDEAG
jgi:hypothetical protein